MKRAIAICVFALACKRHETASQIAPAETTATATAAATAPLVSVEPIPSSSAAPSASVGPGEHAIAENDAEKQAAKKKALEDAREFGMIGLVGDAGDFGPGGLGTTVGPGISLGTLGRIGDAGTSHGGASVRPGTITVNGRLPPEVIQRIVRQNFGRFRLCYQTGLKSNPTLQGRVSTKYVIDRDGSVKSTQDAGSDMPDQGVVQCVVRAFGNLSYPQPEGGIVTVVFPLIFSPSSP